MLNRAHLSRIVNHGMHCVAQPGHEHQVWSQSVSGELGNTAWKKRMTQGLVLSRFFDTVSPKRLNKGEELIIGFVKVIMPAKDDPKILSPSYIRDDWLHGKCAFLLSEEVGFYVYLLSINSILICKICDTCVNYVPNCEIFPG